MLTASPRRSRFLIAVATFLLALSLGAIQPPDVPSAPIPVQILSAHKVFIANGESTGRHWPPTLVYDSFYAGMKSWAKYELVSTPVEADVVLDVRYLEGIYPASTERVQILVLDPKTHVTLWQFMEPIQNWARDDTGRKNFESAMNALINDVKKLTAGPDDKH
jgi:hypothetical protein